MIDTVCRLETPIAVEVCLGFIAGKGQCGLSTRSTFVLLYCRAGGQISSTVISVLAIFEQSSCRMATGSGSFQWGCYRGSN